MVERDPPQLVGGFNPAETRDSRDKDRCRQQWCVKLVERHFCLPLTLGTQDRRFDAEDTRTKG